MLARKSIAIALVSVAFLVSQRSVAQASECTSNPDYGNVPCQGHGCSGYYAWLPMPVDYGEGTFWVASKASCPGAPPAAGRQTGRTQAMCAKAPSSEKRRPWISLLSYP